MIKGIEIIINNGIKEDKYLISYLDKTCYTNTKKYTVSDNFLNEIKNTIVYWKKEYGKSNVIDAEEFTIKIYSDTTDIYHGKGIYPDNYNYLKELLGDYDG